MIISSIKLVISISNQDLQKNNVLQVRKFYWIKRTNSTKANFSLRNLWRSLITIRKALNMYNYDFANDTGEFYYQEDF